MSVLSYFFLNVKKELFADPVKRLELLRQCGLEEQLGDITQFPSQASLSDTHKASGPWNTDGVLLAPVGKHTGTPRLTSLQLDQQQWIPVGDGNKAWIGWDLSDLPSPYGLERQNVVQGFKLVDEATNEWITPCARSPEPTYATGFLAKSYRFGADGEVMGAIVKNQEWLWELSGEIRQWYMLAGMAEQKPWTWLVMTAVRLLGVNYRIGPAEINALAECGVNLLTDETIHKICRAAFGFEVLEAAKKKPTESPEESA